jgi:hypothetical protein
MKDSENTAPVPVTVPGKKIPEGMIEVNDWKLVAQFGTYSEAASAGAALKAPKGAWKIRLTANGFAVKRLVGKKFEPGPKTKKTAPADMAGLE